MFPGGLYALGQQAALNPGIALATGLSDDPFLKFSANSGSITAFDVLERLNATGLLEQLKGKVTYRQGVKDRKDVTPGARGNSCLASKWDVLQNECPKDARESVYLAEVRHISGQPCQDGLRHWRKSTLSTTMRERLHTLGMDVRSMVYWDDYSEGLFVGAGSSSYALHADCIPSSNVGSVFAGHKMLAVWRYPDETHQIIREHGREHFAKPLSLNQENALARACCIGLVPPGSVYLFSGCNAHAVCNVGLSPPRPFDGSPLPSIVVSSYEAFIGLHERHLSAVVDMCQRVGAEDANSDSDEELLDFEEDLAADAWRTRCRLISGEILNPEAARFALSYLLQNNQHIFQIVSERELVERCNLSSDAVLDSEESFERRQKRRRQQLLLRRKGRSDTASFSALKDLHLN